MQLRKEIEELTAKLGQQTTAQETKESVKEEVNVKEEENPEKTQNVQVKEEPAAASNATVKKEEEETEVKVNLNSGIDSSGQNLKKNEH